MIDAGLPTFELDGEEVAAVNRVKALWSVNPSIGGPIVRDRLWFFGSYTRQVADSYVAFFEDVDPNAFVYEPDTSRQAFDDQDAHDVAVRLTWQATQEHKIQFYRQLRWHHPRIGVRWRLR